MSSTIYVTTSGNDSTGNGSVENPYLTISKAFSVALNTSTIIVNDSGTYTVVEGGANQVTTASGKLKTGLTNQMIWMNLCSFLRNRTMTRH